jgi:hypothetical protein
MTTLRFDLDWLRIGAFALLILYHIGMVFVPWDYHIKTAQPARWVEMYGLTLKKALWHFLHWRSTVTRLMDVVQLPSSTKQAANINATGSTLSMTAKPAATPPSSLPSSLVRSSRPLHSFTSGAAAPPAHRLAALVVTLCEHPMARDFQEPVVDVPGYSALVTRPMDYGTLRAALARGVDIVRLIADARLVPFNCRLFNIPGSTIWRIADLLSRVTETTLRDKVRLTDEQAKRLAAIRAVETPEMPRWRPDKK